MKASRPACALLLLFILTLLAAPAVGQEPQSPEQFFGFRMGDDGRLARWDRIVEYFRHLDAASDRIVVSELGESTLGNPFLLAVISSPENLAEADRYMEINRRLADPRGLGDEEIERLAAEGRYTLAVTNGLHATEVGGTQMAVELAYELITDESSLGVAVRGNCFLLLFPCFNPDGQIMVVDWFERTAGGEYEGARLPYLYHHYCGHDNNRDGYMLTQSESRHVSRVMYHQWFPHAYIDHHQMGSYGARFYIPPYYDPVHPNVDPLLWREHLLYGAQMALRLEQAGVSGVETGAPYTAWWMPSFHMITNYHSITGMLTESASAELAAPKYIHPHQLEPGWRGRPEYRAQVNFPNPWPGGWWRLRDIVEQMKISTLAALELGARNREMLLRGAAMKARRNVERGRSEPPYAYLVPVRQHDPLTALRMLETLMLAGVKVHRAEEEIMLGSEVYPAGTYVLRLDQPLRTYVKSLLERIDYPDNEWTRARDGSPMRPYDLAAFTMAEQMGVEVVEAREPLGAAMSVIEGLEWPEGRLIGDGEHGYLLCANPNDGYTALNRILEAGGSAWWLAESTEVDGTGFAPGAKLVRADRALLERVAAELHLTFVSAPDMAGLRAYALRPLRLGVYRRYQGGNMDEGWTRFVLEQFEFPYASVMSDEIRQGGLRERYDVILLPADRLETLIGPDYEDLGPGERPVPPEFRSGLGEDGIAALREFVEAGGTLVALDSACELPIERFELPVANALEGLESTEFFCPGSTLWMRFDVSHPVAFGMPQLGLGLFRFSPAFAVQRSHRNDLCRVVAGYRDENPLRSGWLIGERRLRGLASVVEARLGAGKVILFGMRPQHRAQTHGTFRLLFNALYYGAAEPTVL